MCVLALSSYVRKIDDVCEMPLSYWPEDDCLCRSLRPAAVRIARCTVSIDHSGQLLCA